MECPHCGEEIGDGSTFCPECLTLIDDEDSAASEADSSGFSISLPSVSRRVVLVGLVFLVVTGGIGGVLYTDVGSFEDIQGAVSGLSDTTDGIVGDRVTAPADELVIQIGQLDLGWQVTSENGSDGILFLTPVFANDVPSTAYTTGFEKEETSELLTSTVAVMNSSDEAGEQYEAYTANASAEYSTERASVGDNGLVYTDGGSTVVVFRDRNVFAVVMHTTGTNRPAVNRTVGYADLVTDNIDSTSS